MGYNSKVNLHAYAVKFFADCRDVTDLSDEGLKAAFAECIRPAREKEYPIIRLHIAIEHVRNTVSNTLSHAVNGCGAPDDTRLALLAQESIVQGALNQMEIIAGEMTNRLTWA